MFLPSLNSYLFVRKQSYKLFSTFNKLFIFLNVYYEKLYKLPRKKYLICTQMLSVVWLIMLCKPVTLVVPALLSHSHNIKNSLTCWDCAYFVKVYVWCLNKKAKVSSSSYSTVDNYFYICWKLRIKSMYFGYNKKSKLKCSGHLETPNLIVFSYNYFYTWWFLLILLIFYIK